MYRFLLPILISPLVVLSQAPDTLWTKIYGGIDYDYGMAVQQITFGGYVVVGRTNSLGVGDYDAWLIRTDESGDTLWTKTFGGIDSDAGNYFQQTSDGGFIIVGNTYSYGSGGSDIWLIRTDATGDTLWTRTFGGTVNDYGSFVQQTSDGGFILTGSIRAHSGGEDLYLIRTDEIGSTLWIKNYWTSGSEGGQSVQQTSDGGFIISGYKNTDAWLLKTDASGDTLWTRTFDGRRYGRFIQQTSDGGFIIAGGLLNAWLIKTDASGDTLWTRTYGGSGYDAGYSVQQTSDGGFIIAGTTDSYGAGSNDAWLIRTDASGDTLWTRTFGGTINDYGSSVQQTSDGGYILVGYTGSYGSGGFDVWLIKMANETPQPIDNLSATPGDQQITLTWDANSEADLAKYRIYRDTSSPTTTLIDSVIGSPPDTVYTDTGLTNGQIYFYRITAVDSAGNESGYSDEVSAIPYLLLSILSAFPEQNDLNVSLNVAISVTFNDSIISSTIDTNTFIVHASQTGFHKGTYIYNSEMNKATFIPTNHFAAGEIVSVILTTGICQAISSDSLLNPYVWSFTIESIGGSGTFQVGLNYDTEDSPQSVCSSDLDGDGYLDLVVSNSGSSSISVFINNGDFSFQDRVDYPAGSCPYSICSSDLDSDGDIDLVVANRNAYSISILLNNGDGTFQNLMIYDSGGNFPNSVSCADLDGDGDSDLAVANHGSSIHVAILKNNGDGTFQNSVNYRVGATPYSVFISDLNNDWSMDLAVANMISDNVSVLINNGDGTFKDKVDYETGDYPKSVHSSDLNGDGSMDLAIANYLSNTVSILFNNGDGTFQNKIDYQTGSNPTSICSSDLDGDNDLDLAVANWTADSISVLLNNGDGTFQNKIDYQTGSFPSSIYPSDLDGDGTIELAVTHWGPDNVSIFKNILYLSPPQNLTATPGDRRVTLSWSAYTEGDLAKYRIYRDTASPASTLIDSVVGTPPDTFYTDTGLTNGLEYFYRITAVDSAGNESGYSDEKSATPVSVEIALSDTSHAFGNVQVDSSTSWTFSIRNDGTDTLTIGNITNVSSAYSVSPTAGEVNPSDSLGVTVTFVPSAISTYLDTLHIHNNDSDPSDTLMYVYLSGAGIDTLAPAAPTGLTATPGNQQITLTWNANSEPDLAKYRIYQDTTSLASMLIDSVVGTPPDTTYTDTGLSNGQTYYYRITAVDAAGNESGYSAEVSGTPAAPLAGTYLIDKSGAGDFDSFGAAVSELNTRGITAPVAFLVRKGGDGVYNEQISINAIPGVSNTNTITFQSETGNAADVLLTFAAYSAQNNYVVQINEASHITIKNISLSATGTTYARVMQIQGHANNITLRDNIFSSIVGTSGDRTLISTTGILGDSLFIRDNIFNYGSVGVHCETPRDSGYGYGFQIDGNSFINQYYSGIELVFINSPVISHNLINTSSSYDNYQGIAARFCANGLRIDRNKIIIAGERRGIFLFDCEGTSSEPGLIANNAISMGGISSAYGIDIESSVYQNIYHNTVHISSTSIESGRAIYAHGSGSNINIQNNIFANTGAGYAYYILDTSAIVISDYNDIYTTGERFAYWLGVEKGSDLATLQANSGREAHSLSADPQFADAVSHDYNLLDSSPVIGGGAATGIALADTIDLEGNARPNPAGSSPDLGAYESLRAIALDIIPPAAPQNITAIPGDRLVTLTWLTNSENDLAKYRIYRDTDSPASTLIDSVVGSPLDTTYIDSGLTNGQTYYYCITAMDTAGNEGGYSEEVSAVPRSPYPIMTGHTEPSRPLGWREPTITFTFNQPLDPATITSGSLLLEHLTIAKHKFVVSYDLLEYQITVESSRPITSLDTITITLVADKLASPDGYLIDGNRNGLAEGSPEDDIVTTYAVAAYADFDSSGAIDFDDLTRFVAGWYAHDYTFELGPSSGTVPYLLMEPDGDFSGRDLITFIRMWDWYSQYASPLAKIIADRPIISPEVSYENGRLLIHPEKLENLAALHLQITYPSDKVHLNPELSDSSRFGLQLERNWSKAGVTEIDLAMPIEPSNTIEVQVNMEIIGREPVDIGVYIEAVDKDGRIIGQGETTIEVLPIPTEFALHQNYPNPFNPNTTIRYDLPMAGDVTLIVYDLLGREVARLVDSHLEAGYRQVIWSGKDGYGRDISSGIYIARLVTPEYAKSIKLVLLK